MVRYCYVLQDAVIAHQAIAGDVSKVLPWIHQVIFVFYVVVIVLPALSMIKTNVLHLSLVHIYHLRNVVCDAQCIKCVNSATNCL